MAGAMSCSSTAAAAAAAAAAANVSAESRGRRRSSAAAAAAAANVSAESRGRRRSSAARSGRHGGERGRSSLCLAAAKASRVARSEKANSFFGGSTVLARNDRRAAVTVSSSGSHGGVLPRVISAMDKPAREGEGGGGEGKVTKNAAAMAGVELAGGVGGKAAALAALAVALGSAALLGPGAAHAAAQVTANVALTDGGVDTDAVSTAIAGGGAIAAIAAALSFADPEKRRKQQASEVGGDDMDVVRNYFNSTGFDRWRKIYGETDDVNKVQMDIREGHAMTIEKVVNWLTEDGALQGVSVCDVGCGTGSLSIPLALAGATVNASDISKAMVDEAARRAAAALKTQPNGGGGSPVQPVFEAKDLESVSGKYHTVACLDVLIHYPQDRASDMLAHLASLAEKRIIISFAPKTLFYSFLKRVGELFPGPSKATRAYLHAEEDVEAALKAAGWQVRRREMTSTKFYFSRLLEATPIGSSSS